MVKTYKSLFYFYVFNSMFLIIFQGSYKSKQMLNCVTGSRVGWFLGDLYLFGLGTAWYCVHMVVILLVRGVVEQ